MADLRDCAYDDSGTRILVVEDSDPIRRVVCAMLSQSGYTCIEASDGSEALDLLRAPTAASPIRLVLTDVLMPKMSGDELACYVHREFPSIPILFMSGYAENPLVQAIQHTPIFLPKPFTSGTLTSSVRRALEQPWPGITAWFDGLQC
jgi:two-component system, cell cycle sensor histidine kinase and response regulator CckA